MRKFIILQFLVALCVLPLSSCFTIMTVSGIPAYYDKKDNITQIKDAYLTPDSVLHVNFNGKMSNKKKEKDYYASFPIKEFNLYMQAKYKECKNIRTANSNYKNGLNTATFMASGEDYEGFFKRRKVLSKGTYDTTAGDEKLNVTTVIADDSLASRLTQLRKEDFKGLVVIKKHLEEDENTMQFVLMDGKESTYTNSFNPRSKLPNLYLIPLVPVTAALDVVTSPFQAILVYLFIRAYR